MSIENKIIEDFTTLYYSKSEAWTNPWMGVTILKTPLDLWIYQEIIFENKPTLIIECGSNLGGSALYFASLLELIGDGRVISIDILDNINKIARAHKRIEFIHGSSLDKKVIDQIHVNIKSDDRVMVSLDSCHECSHVLNEMNIYDKFVTIGQYMIIEDSCIRHPVLKYFPPGPYEAIEEYFKTTNNFMIDKTKEKFLMTFNPNGYLKRIK